MRPKGTVSAVVAMDLGVYKQSAASGNPKQNIIIGRENTQVEIWIDISPLDAAVPVFELFGKIEVGESITNIKLVDFGDRREGILTTYSGKIFGVYNDDDSTLAGLEKVMSENEAHKNNRIQLEKEKKNLEKMEQDVRKAKMADNSANQVRTLKFATVLRS